MNSKQLKIIALVLAVAVGLYLPGVFRDSGSEGSVETDGFEFVVTEAIERVDIIQPGDADTVRLASTIEGWTVDGYAADQQKVDDLLAVVGDLSSTVLVARNPSNHVGLGVDDTGRRIEIQTQSGQTSVFHLGNPDTRAGGYFVRIPGTDPVFRLEGSAGGYLGRERDGWRPRVIASVDTAGVRELVLRRGDRETVVRRTATGWSAGEAEADGATVAGLLGMLPTLSATGYPTEEEERAADFSLAEASLDVFSDDDDDVTGRRLVLSLRLLSDANRGDWLVRLADGDEVYRLAEFTVNRLVPEALIP